MNVNIHSILQRVYGPKGIPFPKGPNEGSGKAIAAIGEYPNRNIEALSQDGGTIRKYDDELLGSYQFLPATITWKDLKTNVDHKQEMPNALVIITGEKEFVQTDIVDVGTVFEQVFIKPYDITIICTLVGDNGNWPEDKLKSLIALWKHDGVVTLECALTNLFLTQKENNFIIQRIDQLSEQGSENVEVIQFTGMSNIDFELTIVS